MGALRLYQLLIFLAAPLVHWSLNRRAAQGREDRARLREKFGRPALKRPNGHLIWVHAASVGEVNSVLPLLGDILRSRPTQQILLTSGTLTSAQIVARWQSQNSDLRARLKHQFAPLDRTPYIRRFLDHWQPQAALWVESEIWPNMVLALKARQLPLIMLNGRLSPKSYAGWQRFRGAARHLLGSFTLLMAQDETTAARLTTLTSQAVRIPGNLKLDAPALPYDADALAELDKKLGDRPRFLAASTHDDEETQIAHALNLVHATLPDTLAIIVPRHPDRGHAIAEVLRARGLHIAQRSQGEMPNAQTQIYLADTLGELGLFYRLTNIVFIGGTLVPHGGQNPMEAAQLDCALLHGPHIENFSEIFDTLAAKQAVASIVDVPTLAAQISALLQNQTTTRNLADAAANYTNEMSGTRERVIGLLDNYLVGPDAAPESGPAYEAHDG